MIPPLSSHGDAPEENCRIDQIVDSLLPERDDNAPLEQAKFAELVVFNELIFGSPDDQVYEAVEKRAINRKREQN